MILSTSIGAQMKYYSPEEIIDLMAEAGFDALDFSFSSCEKYYNESMDDNTSKAYFTNLRNLAEQKGLRFNQAHAPFASSSYDDAWTAKRFEEIVRSMRNSSYLGIGTVVVHPIQHLTYADKSTPEKLFEMNMDFYNRLKPYCEEYNIKVAVENMWQSVGKKITHSTCSRPKEFIQYLDELNSEWFVGCLDIGHAFLVCEDPADFIRELGSKRLKALHVHDVDGLNDSHTLPYYGIINWDEVMKALKEIGYEGDFTYEVDYFTSHLPKELHPTALKQVAQTGRYLLAKI